jgi:hypothetical protein
MHGYFIHLLNMLVHEIGVLSAPIVHTCLHEKGKAKAMEKVG